MEQLSKDETLKLRERYVGDACAMFFQNDPLKIVRASGQYMYDEKDNRYLDCINNVCHVGHCHPDVVEAGCNQMKQLNTNCRFLHDNIVLLAKKLTSTFPESLSVVFFVNSGSEANDLAMRLAHHHTGGRETIVLDHAYHGHIQSTIDISPYKFNPNNNLVKPDYVHVAASPDVFHGKYRDIDYPGEDLGIKYAKDVADIIQSLCKNKTQLSSFIAESMQSCGGQVILPDGYLKEVYKLVRAAGGVCIADEVQVGFGRVGSHYWSFETQDVIPDIVTIGKPMGNGHPVAAVVTTKEISKSFADTGGSYFNTYGGNPVSCAIALAVLKVIEKEHLRENATKIGKYILDQAQKMASKHPLIGDVRGVGLFIGLDLVKDRQTREPASAEAKYIIYRMKNEFVLLSCDGPYANVLKIKPPMCFNKENADELICKLEKIISEVEERGISNLPGTSATANGGSTHKGVESKNGGRYEPDEEPKCKRAKVH